jgi:hypothetical protein
MTATTVFVELVGALMPIFHTFMQYCDDVFLASAFDDHQILNKKTIFNIPATLQNSTAWV